MDEKQDLPVRNPARGPVDMYALVLHHKERVFRVFAPMTKTQALRARRRCLRSWQEYGPDTNGYEARVIQCWTDWEKSQDL